jgi:hypothetical protein
MPFRGLAANVCGDQVRKGILYIREVSAMAHLTPLTWTADDGYRFSSRPDDWIAYERSRMRHELTRISRLLSATVAPHAAARPEEEWVNLVLALLNKAGTA